MFFDEMGSSFLSLLQFFSLFKSFWVSLLNDFSCFPFSSSLKYSFQSEYYLLLLSFLVSFQNSAYFLLISFQVASFSFLLFVILPAGFFHRFCCLCYSFWIISQSFSISLYSVVLLQSAVQQISIINWCLKDPYIFLSLLRLWWISFLDQFFF